ncbi:DUF5050 domain-containing protein [Anaerolineales bacterium HSG6]|nr:DUF5050 domain-containing protein [Anaerolineales bacterium HSG6]MDM8531060.1 DUF5050 domain-containing protein [Anaerolineales bacterium HSG25]
MTLTIVISIILLVIGLAGIMLSFLENFEEYRSYLLLLGLFMIAASIGLFVFNFFSDTTSIISPIDSPIDTPVPPTATIVPEPAEPQSSEPIAPTLQEVDVSEINFEGCLLFVSDRSDDFEIYKIAGTPDNVTQLTNSPGLDISASWSLNGESILFASKRDEGAGFQIYMMDKDGNNQQRVGDIQPGDNTSPYWSPDQQKIVFQSNRDTNNNPADDDHDLYTMNTDGTNVASITLNEIDDTKPVWSTTGHIFFLSERTGQDEIYSMTAEGTELKQLTTFDELKGDISVSADSKLAIFEAGGDIYSIDSDGQTLNKLTTFNDSSEGTPFWGKDENFIFFSSNRSGDWELYLLDRSNPQEHYFAQLTNNPTLDRYPVWYPCEAP